MTHKSPLDLYTPISRTKSPTASKQGHALELLHQILPHGPHARPLAVDVHRDRRQQTRHLDASNGDEHLLRAVGLEPAVEEEGED
jgi:hypothetical protein